MLYQKKLMTYNTHVIRHIPEFVKLYGTLDSWSAFVFENYLGILKRRMKCTNGIFSQTLNNLNLIKKLFASKSERNFVFSDKCPDNCAILEDATVVLISEINIVDGTIYVNGYKLRFSESLYMYPYSSAAFNIGFYERSSHFVCKKIAICKCILIPKNDKFLVIPLVQNELFVQ